MEQQARNVQELADAQLAQSSGQLAELRDEVNFFRTRFQELAAQRKAAGGAAGGTSGRARGRGVGWDGVCDARLLEVEALEQVSISQRGSKVGAGAREAWRTAH